MKACVQSKCISILTVFHISDVCQQMVDKPFLAALIAEVTTKLHLWQVTKLLDVNNKVVHDAAMRKQAGLCKDVYNMAQYR